MDNLRLIPDGNDDKVHPPNLVSEKQNYGQLDSLRQIGTLPNKDASASMLSEVTDHFKTTFSNVANGEASATEYLEVGALAVGAVAMTYAARRLGARSTPVDGSAFSVVEKSITLPARNPATLELEQALTTGKGMRFISDHIMTDAKLSGILPRLASSNRPVHLNFEGSFLTDKGAAQLLELRHNLKSLDISRTHVTEAGLQMLSRGLPKTSIVSNSRHAMGLRDVPELTKSELDEIIAKARAMPQPVGRLQNGNSIVLNTERSEGLFAPIKPIESPALKWKTPTDDRHHLLLSHRRWQRPMTSKAPETFTD